MIPRAKRSSWEEMYGFEKSQEMKRKMKKNRNAPSPMTSFARKWKLGSLKKKDREGVQAWMDTIRRITHKSTRSVKAGDTGAIRKRLADKNKSNIVTMLPWRG